MENVVKKFKKFIPILFFVLMIFNLFGCTNNSNVSLSSIDETLRYDPYSSTGKSFELEFKTNPTTGFDYSYTQLSGDGIARLLLEETIEEDRKIEDLAGAPIKRKYVFTAKNEGNNTLTFQYSRPWEGGEVSHKVYYDFVVDEEKNIKFIERRFENVDYELSSEQIEELPFPVFK